MDNAKTKYALYSLIIAAGIFLGIGGALVSSYFLVQDKFQISLPIILGYAGSAFLLILGISILPTQRKLREQFQAEGILEGNSVYQDADYEERQEMDRERRLEAEKILSGAEFTSLIRPGSANPQADLDSLIGLDEVKDEVTRLAVQMELNRNPIDKKTRAKRQTQTKPFPVSSMCFIGNAGTGKTSVSSIITGFFYQYGYIDKNEYIATDGNFFKSSIDPVKRTRILLNRSKGKVLFIDEAYSMVMGNPVGEEVLATLINEMENNRDKLILMFAGYKNEMREFLLTNSGFNSRIKSYIFFEDYDNDQLLMMFNHLMKKNGLSVTMEGENRLAEIIDEKRTKKGFANARTVRNIAEKSIIEHALRLKNDPGTEPDKIAPSDIVADDRVDQFLGKL